MVPMGEMGDAKDGTWFWLGDTEQFEAGYFSCCRPGGWGMSKKWPIMTPGVVVMKDGLRADRAYITRLLAERDAWREMAVYHIEQMPIEQGESEALEIWPEHKELILAALEVKHER